MNSENQYFERLKNNERPVVVDFWAPWCGPCKSIEPMLKRLGTEYAGRVDVWRVNADENPEVLRKLRIYGIPTLIAYHQGQEVTRRVGAASPATLGDLFEASLQGEKPVSSGIPFIERLIRLGAGAFLVALAYMGSFSSLYILIALLGGLIMFSAVRDRCPVWQAIAPRLGALLSGGK